MFVLGFFQNIGMPEGLMLLAVGLLLFGKRLPEVGRGLGKGIVEFKRGLKGISDEVEEESSRPAAPKADRAEQTNRSVAPRAELPNSAPVAPQATVLDQPPVEEVRVSRNDKFE